MTEPFNEMTAVRTRDPRLQHAAAGCGGKTSIRRWPNALRLELWRRIVDRPFKLSLDAYVFGSLELAVGSALVAPHGGKRAASIRGIDGTPVSYSPPSLLYLAPQEVLVIEPDEVARKLLLIVVPAEMVQADIVQGLSHRRAWSRLPVRSAPAMWSCFRDVADELTNGCPTLEERRRMLRRLLEAALAEHQGGTATRSASGCERAVVRAKETLRRDLSATLTLDQLASQVQTSKYYLARSFLKRVGVTLFEYRKLARLQRALHLVRTGAPLREAATQSGFVDQAHLTRELKKYFGFTPGEYRSAIQS